MISLNSERCCSHTISYSLFKLEYPNFGMLKIMLRRHFLSWCLRKVMFCLDSPDLHIEICGQTITTGPFALNRKLAKGEEEHDVFTIESLDCGPIRSLKVWCKPNDKGTTTRTLREHDFDNCLQSMVLSIHLPSNFYLFSVSNRQ